MKFVSWNVNGLRACIQKGFLEQFQRLDADFFCLQETKLSAGQLELELPGYEQYWCYAEKKGYSGTAIFTKHHPLSVTYGIGVPELDNEGRVITLEYHEFYLVTCYTPNAQRGLARLEHRMTWDEAFRTYLKALDEVKPVVLCGDLNVAHKEIDLKNPASNRGNAGFSDEERQSFQKTLDLGFTDTFRHLYPDAVGRYSWWSYMFHARENNAGWRIDYFLTSSRLDRQIQQADILSDILGSDHCPVILELDTLVNGGIWSPNAGTPSVIEKEPTKKKSSKASPVNGKALALLYLLLAVVLTVATIPILPARQSTDPAGPTVDPDVPFAVHVLEEPFHEIYISSENYFSSTLTYAADRLSDGQTAFYVEGYDSHTLKDSNFWLRIELSALGRSLYTKGFLPDILCLGDLVSSSLSFPSHMDQCTVIPYYTDAARENIGGWLVWGVLNVDDTLMISLPYHDHCEAVALDIEPPVTDGLDSPDKIITVLPLPINLTEITHYYTSPSVMGNDSVSHPGNWVITDDGVWPVTPLDIDLIEPADFWVRIALTDEALQIFAGRSKGITYSGDKINCIPYYTDDACVQTAGWFLFGTADTTVIDFINVYCDSIVISDIFNLSVTHFIRQEQAQKMSTEALIAYVLTNPGIQIDISAPDLSSDDPYTWLISKYPALAELETRNEAVKLLLAYTPETDGETLLRSFLLDRWLLIDEFNIDPP